MKYGYARTNHDQDVTAQVDAVKAAGAERVYYDINKGSREDRPAYNELLALIGYGDTLIVTELHRLTRDVISVIDIIRKGVEIVVLEHDAN